MSWERRNIIETFINSGCIPCGDMSWEKVGEAFTLRDGDAFRVET